MDFKLTIYFGIGSLLALVLPKTKEFLVIFKNFKEVMMAFIKGIQS